MTHPQIAAFAREADENDPPVRILEGQKTLLSRTMHGMGFDAIHDEIVVNSPIAQAILIFSGAASGEEAPLRYIQGPKTQILGMGYSALSTVTPDPHNDEIFLPVATGGYRGRGTGGEPGVLVFDRLADGDVAPKRILRGPNTGITGGNQLAIDHMADLLIAKSRGSIMIFDRDAEGDTAPLRVIGGPNSMVGGGQTITYPEKGWIITGTTDRNRDGGYGVWHVTDDGDVPPRWVIPVQSIVRAANDHAAQGRQNVGVAIIPQAKELWVTSSQSNRVLVFSFPELFE